MAAHVCCRSQAAEVPVSAGILVAASSWLVLRLRSGSSRRETHTHTHRHTLWQEERSPTVGPLLNVVHRRTFQSPKSRPEPLHVIMYMFETSLPIPIIQIIIIPKNPNPCMRQHAGWPCTCTGTTCLLYTGYSTVLQACTSCCYHNYSPHRKDFVLEIALSSYLSRFGFSGVVFLQVVL